MVSTMGCEFRGRGSIPSVCQITDAALGQVGQLNHSLNGGLLHRLAMRYPYKEKLLIKKQQENTLQSSAKCSNFMHQ